MKEQSIIYNNKIGEITGQSKIKQEILYAIHNEKYTVFQIVGGAGSGKTTLSDIIARDFLSQYRGNIFYINPAYQEVPEDYSTFKVLLHQNNQDKKRILNIFEEIAKDIPHFGNSLSALITQVISAKLLKEDIGSTFAESEQFIVSILQKYQKDADILYICNSYELWDFKSQQLLLHLIEYMRDSDIKNKICFIINSRIKLTKLKKTNIKYKYLNKIEIDSLAEVVSQFNSRLHLNGEQIEQINSLTDGNLELIKECANLFDSKVVSVNMDFYDILKSHIKSMIPQESDALLLMLKEMAFIGEGTDKRFLSHFVSTEPEMYESLLGKAIQLSLLSEKQYFIAFAQKYVYSILQKMLYKDRKYYHRVVDCINILYPSRYDLQMIYLYRGEIFYEADRIFFIYLISFYRENNKEYDLDNEAESRLSQNDLYPIYLKICEAYKFYKRKKYREAENTLALLVTADIAFRFEIDYLQALITTNKYNTAEEYSERIDKLQPYIDNEFKKMYPEMYMRAQMILIELYAEIDHEKEMRNSLSEIMKYFARYSSTDKQIQCYEYCFKMKANAYYKIEVAERETQAALNYFKNNDNKQRYISKYYLALLNHAANKIVLGQYDDSSSLLHEAYCVALQYPHIKTLHEDILLNNIIISGFCSHKYSAEECAKAMDKVLKGVQDQADFILLKSNLAVFKALSGSYESAIDCLAILYNKIQFNDDIDDYYRYFVLNNYGILLWIIGQKQKSTPILNDAFLLNPLPRDHSYFKARANSIRLLIEEKCASDIMQNDNWNQYLFHENPNIVGSAWKFWSSLLLLSELQIWSDY